MARDIDEDTQELLMLTEKQIAKGFYLGSLCKYGHAYKLFGLFYS